MVFVLAILECTGTMYIWTKTFMPSWQYEQSACLAGRCTPPPPPGGACAGQVFTSTSSKPTQISRGHRQGEEEKEEKKEEVEEEVE